MPPTPVATPVIAPRRSGPGSSGAFGSLVICRSARPSATETRTTEPLLVAGDNCIERPHAGTVENEGAGKPDDQEVVLESLALRVPVPVHEEAVLPVNGQDRAQHDGGDAERRHSRQETHREAQRPEK